MGMFDSLRINRDKLPVTDKEKKLINVNHDWQTKDFDCILTILYITDDGLLKVERWEEVVVPKEERPHPNDDGIMGLIGSVKKINLRQEIIKYHGYVNFYGYVGEDWYEFDAKFTNGKLETITGGKRSN